MATPTNSGNSPRRSRRSPWGVLGIVLLAVVAVFVLVDVAGRALVDSDDADDPDEPVAGVTEVAVRDNEFEPEAIAVPLGTTVTWRWEGDDPHNVVCDGFESPVQDDGTFVHTFADAGTYDYRCTLHPGMSGEVVVAGEAGSDPGATGDAAGGWGTT